jgi:hypothetical protein
MDRRLCKGAKRILNPYFAWCKNIGIHDRRLLKDRHTSISYTSEYDYVMQMNYEMIIKPMIT